MRILFLTYGPQSGVVARLNQKLTTKGVVFAVRDLTNGLTISRNRFRLYPNAVNILISMLQAMYYFKKEWLYLYLRTPYAFRHMSNQAGRLIAKEKADVILQSGVLFSPSLAQPQKPFFLGIIDNTYRMGRRFLPRQYEEYEANVYHFATKIFAMSESVKRSLLSDYGLSQDKIEVVGVGPNVTPEMINGTMLSSKRDPHRIVFIGKGFQNKGGYVLLEAFETVRRRIPTATLSIIGDDVNVGNRHITVRGIIPQAEVAQELAGASLFVLPTLKEAFGIAFLDAMSFKLPCIGTNIGAIPEIIDDGKTGYLVPPEDPRTLASKMVELLKNKKLARRMGNNGYQKVLTKFNWETISNRIYTSIISCL